MTTEIVSETPATEMWWIVLKRDSRGFMLQECPSCRRRFKVHPEENDAKDKPLAHCPHCDHDGLQCWWTPEQASYITAEAARKLAATSKYFKAPAEPSQPPAEMEDDLPHVIEFSCCNERIRHEGASTELRCIVCGTKASAT